MIGVTDIEDILVRDFSEALGIAKTTSEPPKADDKNAEGIKKEMVVVHVKRSSEGTIFDRGFVEVNLCVPDFKSGERNRPRLQALEHMAKEMLRTAIVGEYDGTAYRYSRDSIGMEREPTLKCSYVNVRLLFEVHNII